MALTEVEKRADKKEKPLTKVIVRRLPPTMTKEQFVNQVSPLPDYNYMYHVKGDMSLGENAFSRAYINFVCPEDVYTFKEKFDNYVFVDTRGHEYTAVVEFAPFQKVPKRRGKGRMDPKCNTIESDTYYMEFVENLNKPLEQNAKPEYSLQLGGAGDNKKKDVTTPLLEFIKNKRAQKLKIREVRREERERRKKEYERRKEQGKYEGKYSYEDKKYDEKSPIKTYGKKTLSKSFKNDSPKEQAIKEDNSEEKLVKSPKEKADEKVSEKQPHETKIIKEKKYEEKKERKEIKLRFPKKDYSSEFRGAESYSSRENRSRQYDDHKKEDTKIKKVKKYSEKREERKLEAQKKLEQAKEKDQPNEGEKESFEVEKSVAKPKESVGGEEKKESQKQEHESKKKDINDDKSEGSKRMRNKDRPTIPIYRPGMLSRKKTSDRDESPKKEEKDKSEDKK
ncbi:regulator of nonsense transcripts 3B-like [Anthonomus grandis grandis]|uniref:regulator of nonsense transcripts 3B-like n=1 Tax=Anthonomus grandis grandis TaxID=2921223 RepID=UPI002165582D|nr:regulator of nonsense transcripts 3B-like [Anthonomus grandis grandis]